MTNTTLSNVERQTTLLRYIEQMQRVSVVQLCEQFAISPATARRDLDALAEQGKVQRVHGGVLAVRKAPPELPALQRAAEQTDEKKRIAAVAAQLIEDGDTVFMGSGTTVAEVAVFLRERPHLTVITNSLLVINALADAPAINVISLGGILRRTEMSLIGHIAEQALAEVRTNKVILGIRAIDVEQGLTNDYVQETMTDRAILKIGQQVIVVADHTKCGRVSTAFVAPLNAMHILVTDSETPKEFVEAVTAKGIRVITA
jgi:DeoR/GlpR family transcriptional regulator of sugar metabolism